MSSDKKTKKTTPKMTPEIAEKLTREGEELRKKYHKRLLEMWNISYEDMKRKCNCVPK